MNKSDRQLIQEFIDRTKGRTQRERCDLLRGVVRQGAMSTWELGRVDRIKKAEVREELLIFLGYKEPRDSGPDAAIKLLAAAKADLVQRIDEAVAILRADLAPDRKAKKSAMNAAKKNVTIRRRTGEKPVDPDRLAEGDR